MMEASGKKIILEEAKENKQKVKLIFQYPASPRAIIKSGQVIECYYDSFWFEDIYDGKGMYSYEYLIEVKEVRE